MRILIKLSLITFFLSCSSAEKKAPDLLSCVPQNTLAILQINDQNMLNNSQSSNPFIGQILKVDPNLFSDASAVTPKQFTSKSLLCFTPEGKAEMAVTFLFKLQPQDSISLPKGETFQYNNIKVVVTEVNDKDIYHAHIKGISISSTSKLILENSIRNAQNNRLGIQEGVLYDLSKISDENAPLNLFLNQGFGKTIESVFPNTSLFPFLGSSWFSFDFNTKKEPFVLDGISFINDSIPDKLSLLKGQNPQRLISPQLVPQNFDGYLALSLNDYKALEDQFKQYSRHLNIPLPSINLDLLSTVDELAWVQLQESQSILLHLNNTETVHPELFSYSELRSSFRDVAIYEQTLPEDFQFLLNTMGSFKTGEWSAQIDDFLIYSNSESHLKQIIGNYLDNNTLYNDINFKTLREDLADKSSFLWLGKTPNLKKNWETSSKEIELTWDKINLKAYPLIVLQGISENNFIQTRLAAQKKNDNPQKNSVFNQYSFSLDAPAARAPQWIKNHRNKTMDIVIQDQNNVLYLFSNTGKLFWKKELSGPIIGKIEQIDLYKNRRLQMAFRTSDRFMVLDRNGKLVSPFDIKLSGEGSPHLAVFDYDLNRNYRFIIVDGKQLKMLDNRGKIVSGFRLKTLKNELLHPPKHIRFGSKDYILIQDKEGTVRLLNRQGTDRIKLKESLTTSKNPVFEYRNTFAGTTSSGDMFQIDSKGNITRNKLGMGQDHLMDMTAKSLVYINENMLNIKGIPISLPYGKYTAPKIHYIKNTLYVALTELDTQKVYVYLSNGTLVGGFPVYGTGEPDLINSDNDSAIEMVVQSESNGFFIYQIN